MNAPKISDGQVRMPEAEFEGDALQAPVLGQQGLEHLKARFIELLKAPVEKPREQDHKVIGWGSGGPFYADESAARQSESTTRLTLQALADLQGDVDAFIAQPGEPNRPR
jgi:hypothetical protein